MNIGIKDLAREKQREYMREWRKKNKDKVRQYNADYWLRKAQESREATAEEHK